MLYWRLFFGSLIAKLLVGYHGLKANCLLTRYPIYWLNPNFTDCIHLARLREHGFQVYAALEQNSPRTPVHYVERVQNSGTEKKPSRSSLLQLERNDNFPRLLKKFIELAEKDLLEL